jgi:outer membrane lipoprotein SlyB
VAEALGAVGGALVGGLIGSAAERAANSGDGVEYVVRKRNGELVSVVQRDLVPLEVGARVLVIEGAQARIVPDYTVPAPEAGPGPAPAPAAPSATPPSTTSQQPDEAPDLGIAPAQLLRELPGWMGDGPALQTLPGLVTPRQRSI